ncbi:hypothetical protein ACFXPJ_42055, partial [Streptomyces goshikiensis]
APAMTMSTRLPTVCRAALTSSSSPSGDAFKVIRLDSGPGNPDGFGRLAHSVLTLEVRETAGHRALRAREDVTAFLRERLGGRPQG